MPERPSLRAEEASATDVADGGDVAIDAGDEDGEGGPRTACADGQTECDGTCTSLATDPEHCGRCDVRCGERISCRAGACVDRATAVAAGGVFACALYESGSVWCWGWNQYRQLGELRVTDQTWLDEGGVGWRFGTPVAIGGLPRAKQISAGLHFACALTVNGRVYCWGENHRGQLGHAWARDERCPPAGAKVGDTSNASFCSGPALVDGLPEGIIEVAAGAEHACARTAENVYCWGANSRGQLGTGTTNVSFSSEPVGVSSLPSPPRALSVGHYHACVAGEDGVARCWGESEVGQLGRDSTKDAVCPAGARCSPSPNPVLTMSGETLSGVSSLAAGRTHTCAMTNGGPVCWGANSFAPIGNESFASTKLPPTLPAGLPPTIKRLVAGNWTQAALDTEGRVYAWGLNALGQLGSGELDGTPCQGKFLCRTRPALTVRDLGSVTDFALGLDAGYAVDGQGRVWGWGGLGYGGLGRMPGLPGDRDDCSHPDYQLRICNPSPKLVAGLPQPSSE